MPVSALLTTTDSYENATVLGPLYNIASIQFTVANALVAAQVGKINASRTLYFDESEAIFATGQGGYSGKVYGIRFRSYKAGSPAVVVVNVYFADDPVPFQAPQPFDSTITPGGGITPPSGGGIQFDQDNTGDWLNIVTTARDIATLDGIHIEAQGFPLTIETTPEGGFNSPLNLISHGNGLNLLLDSTVSSTPMFIDTLQGQLISIGATEPASGNVTIGNDPVSVGNAVGFFLNESVQQTLPAAPTGAQIRAVLVAFGLVAP